MSSVDSSFISSLRPLFLYKKFRGDIYPDTGGDIKEFMQDIDNYSGTLKVKYALKISAYIFVRPSELVNSKWEFIDFENSQWLIPAEFMKMKREHLIPFPKQVKELLLLLKPITGHHTYIFPSDKHYDTDMPMHSGNGQQSHTPS